MIWQNAWAWLGLLTLAVPLLIHLLSRRRARVQSFPTLRFLEASRLLPTRRTRISDRLLLALRLAILAAAVAALAQPLLLTAHRQGDLGRTLARAIVLDTSASMLRPALAGGRALDAARGAAQRLASESGTSVILESVAPARSLAGAVAWLDAQPGKREVVIVSDFQSGALEQSDLAVVPPGVGVQLQRVAVATAAEPLESVTRNGGVEIVAQITLAPDRTDVEWTIRDAPAEQGGGLLILTGPAERARADLALRAARTVSTISAATAHHPSALIYPQFEQRAELMRNAQPLNEPWMADVVARLRSDSTFVAAAAASHAGDTAYAAPFVALARTADGAVVALAARGHVQGRDRLLLFSLVDAGSLASAALMTAAANAMSTAPAVTELEPASIPEEALRQWQRPSQPVARPRAEAGNGASDGRWFWLLGLALLALESWLRRAPREAARGAPAAEIPNERVA